MPYTQVWVSCYHMVYYNQRKESSQTILHDVPNTSRLLSISSALDGPPLGRCWLLNDGLALFSLGLKHLGVQLSTIRLAFLS